MFLNSMQAIVLLETPMSDKPSKNRTPWYRPMMKGEHGILKTVIRPAIEATLTEYPEFESHADFVRSFNAVATNRFNQHIEVSPTLLTEWMKELGYAAKKTGFKVVAE